MAVTIKTYWALVNVTHHSKKVKIVSTTLNDFFKIPRTWNMVDIVLFLTC